MMQWIACQAVLPVQGRISAFSANHASIKDWQGISRQSAANLMRAGNDKSRRNEIGVEAGFRFGARRPDLGPIDKLCRSLSFPGFSFLRLRCEVRYWLMFTMHAEPSTYGSWFVPKLHGSEFLRLSACRRHAAGCRHRNVPAHAALDLLRCVECQVQSAKDR